MKKFNKDKLSRKAKKLKLNRETIKDLTLRTQVAGGARETPTHDGGACQSFPPLCALK